MPKVSTLKRAANFKFIAVAVFGLSILLFKLITIQPLVQEYNSLQLMERPSAGQTSIRLSSSCDFQSSKSMDAFEHIYQTDAWGGGSKSGPGSTVTHAYDTIIFLQEFIQKNYVTTIADIPCGDVSWQFAIKSINTAQLYFGADISVSAVGNNAKTFEKHGNKIFKHWDLTICPIPQFQWNNTPTDTWQSFDLVILRDVIQHMPIKDALKAIANIVLYGGDIKYLAVTSFPGSCSEDNCATGRIASGGFYHNNMNCHPFNFPTPIAKQRSHLTFEHESDEIHIYDVRQLRPIVKAYPEDC